jgi:hypothetical protein
VTGTTRSRRRAERDRSDGRRALVADPATEQGAAALRQAAADADAVISVPPGADGDPILAALAQMDLSAKRLIYFSTTGVYGDRKGGWAFEWEPVTPGQERSKRRAKRKRAGWRRAR